MKGWRRAIGRCRKASSRTAAKMRSVRCQSARSCSSMVPVMHSPPRADRRVAKPTHRVGNRTGGHQARRGQSETRAIDRYRRWTTLNWTTLHRRRRPGPPGTIVRYQIDLYLDEKTLARDLLADVYRGLT